jgi:hypothetical protein
MRTRETKESEPISDNDEYDGETHSTPCVRVDASEPTFFRDQVPFRGMALEDYCDTLMALSSFPILLPVI